jgi:hypothetical protein
MNDDLMKQILKLILSENSDIKETSKSIYNKYIGKYVIIRTHSSGIHFGILEENEDDTIILKDARRIWYWEGAFTLSQIAIDGISSKSKLSCTIPEILIPKIIELIPCSEKSINNIKGMKSHEIN